MISVEAFCHRQTNKYTNGQAKYYTERKKKRIFTLVVICIKDVLIV